MAFHVWLYGSEVLHLMFADELLIFGKERKKNMRSIMDI